VSWRRYSSRHLWCFGPRAPWSWRVSDADPRPRACSTRQATTSRVPVVKTWRGQGGEVEFPEYRDEERRATVDHVLALKAKAALSNYKGVAGGYLVAGLRSFLGTIRSTIADEDNSAGEVKSGVEPTAVARGASGLPRLERELIDIQVDAAVRKKQTLFSVEELEGERPVTVAIRTALIVVDGDVVGATWAMTRLVDPLFVDKSLRGYQLAAALALGGIALAFALTASLAQTVRRQSVERDRLQTELRRSERLAALGKLLAGVAHEVRNPLVGIRSTAQLWQRGVVGLDDETLDGLVHEVDRLEEIVSRLLQFSRADSQGLAPGDLNAVMAEAGSLAVEPARSKGVRVELELETDLPAASIAPAALLQVFRNLTSNALQAMDDGGTLRLSTRRDPSRRTIMASVTDSGLGLAPEVIDHLFEPFFTTKAEGTGLGLAIAREIALAHRGELRARNRDDGTGAVFTLVLPAVASDGNGVAP
jgi:two-component system, NtrC family, sensor histidine kinase HydH